MSFRYIADGPPDFKPGKEYPSGLPRPQWRTEKSNQHYDTDTYELPNNGTVSPGDRRLYQKVPVPWNTYDISEDIPQFDKDWVGSGSDEIRDILRDQDHPDKDSHVENILQGTSESYRDRKCPMCGGKFENDDPAVLYTGSTIREILSDWLPYHPHCMDLINKHCPHLRRESDSPGTQHYDNLYEHGTYGDLRKNGIQSYLKYIAGLNHRIAVKPPDFEKGVKYPPGLPRPQWRTEEKMQTYDESNVNSLQNPKIETGDRRLYQKVPVPWNTQNVSNDIPQFDKDIIHPEVRREVDAALNKSNNNLAKYILMNASESAKKKCCPMCGGKFEDDDPAIIYKGSNILDTLSDWLPYHPHCMDLINKHCPHLRRESDSPGTDYYNDIFEYGTYGDLIEKGINTFIDTFIDR